jgi:hypothetical protein
LTRIESPLGAKPEQDADEISNFRRAQSCRGFVEQQKPRTRGERAGDFEPALAAERQGRGGRVHLPLEADQGQQVLRFAPRLPLH